MTSDVLWGLLLGVGLGALYGLSSLLAYRLALRSSRHTFLPIVVGSMLLRMFVALIVVTLILVLAPVSDIAFIGAFFLVFMLGLAAEVVMLHRRTAAADSNP